MTEFKCPHCGNPIYDQDALNCLYCGESLDRETGFLSLLRRPKPRIILFAAVVLILLAFVALFLL